MSPKTHLEKTKYIIGLLRKAPDSQLDMTLQPLIENLLQEDDIHQLNQKLLFILDMCAYSALASDFTMTLFMTIQANLAALGLPQPARVWREKDLTVQGYSRCFHVKV